MHSVLSNQFNYMHNSHSSLEAFLIVARLEDALITAMYVAPNPFNYLQEEGLDGLFSFTLDNIEYLIYASQRSRKAMN